MPQFIFANFVQTTLSATASTTDTSLSVTSASYLPTLESGQQFPLTLVDAATETVYEIVYVTAVNGTTLTVLRGQEGTTAQSWKIGDFVKGSPTTATTSPSPGTHYPTASETLPTTLGKLSVLPGALTADIALTLPGSGDAGSETTIYGSAAAYTTTVASPVTSGSPYIEMPDGSQVYSYVIPASSPGAGIRLDFDGTNYRATTFGATIVAPATASNEAVQLGQVANTGSQIYTVGFVTDGTSLTATSGTFTAPTTGFLMIFGSCQWSASAENPPMTCTASLAGLVTLFNSPNNVYGSAGGVWQLPMTAGQSTTFTIAMTLSAAANAWVGAVGLFIPTP